MPCGVVTTIALFVFWQTGCMDEGNCSERRFQEAFGSIEADDRYDSRYDLNGDGRIDTEDYDRFTRACEKGYFSFE